MQKAEAILQALRKMGTNGIPLTRGYRSLYSEDLYLAAYAKIYKNKGAMTPGSDDDTIDSMSLARIRSVIEQLRNERFRFRPVRRSVTPKKSGGTRKLGLPNFTDKFVQEVLRMLLEAYYEPRFRDSSHGYRPERGCHTALADVKQRFTGSAWLIEGDIKGCFDNINHDVLMRILARDIQDGRLLQLIRQSLEAGVLDEWRYERSYSGTPQGGILSPLLSNIYLHELDVYIEDVLIPQHTQGKSRQKLPAYAQLCYQIKQARQEGNLERAAQLEQERRRIPSRDVDDPNFRRLNYVRYADDFILGFIGTRKEAEAIRDAIGEFLGNHLKLTLSTEKTLITHARTEAARFLNYSVSLYHADDKLTLRSGTKTKTRSINGRVRLGIPFGLSHEKAKPYLKNGKTIAMSAILMHSDAEIIETFQQRFRGLAQYYQYASDRAELGSLKNIMQEALVKTLADKFKITVSQVYRRYRGKLMVDGYEYKVLQVTVPTKKGTRLIHWGAVSLKVVKSGTGQIDDQQYVPKQRSRSDLIQRLQANECELCGSQVQVQVHHIRKLKDLKQRWAGRKEKPMWVERMIAMQRKTLVVCFDCHQKIHAGQPTPKLRR